MFPAAETLPQLGTIVSLLALRLMGQKVNLSFFVAATRCPHLSELSSSQFGFVTLFFPPYSQPLVSTSARGFLSGDLLPSLSSTLLQAGLCA